MMYAIFWMAIVCNIFAQVTFFANDLQPKHLAWVLITWVLMITAFVAGF